MHEPLNLYSTVMRDDSLGADEAAKILGVSKATLYSYVSRGMLTSRVVAPGSRKRAYDRAELMSLKHRSSFRKDPETAAAEVIEFGIPILTTSISQITETEHSYRGVSSRELAQEYSFEQVAEFLWTGRWAGPTLPDPDPAWTEPLDLGLLESVDRDLAPIEQMQSMLPRLQHRNLHAYRTTPEALLGSAIELIRYLVYLSVENDHPGRISESLAASWRVDASVLERLLTVVADHELNIATFTARCAASAGSTLYQAVLAGLAALQGYRHLFGQVSEAKLFIGEVIASGDPEAVVRSYLRRRGGIPGVQNPYRRLYTGPDPRVVTLIDNLAGTEHHQLLLRTMELIDVATKEPPRIDFALAASEPLLGLPHDSIHSMIAIGRTAGMIAHVFEQYGSERVIRPRARYVGETRPRNRSGR